jgi:hypothetical protein
VLQAQSSQSLPPVVAHSIEKIESQLARLEALLLILQQGQPTPIPSLSKMVVSEQNPAEFYQDVAEMQMEPGEQLECINPEQLSPQMASRLEFGQQLLNLVGLAHRVQLFVAKALPPTTLHQNSFANSYVYDHASKKLFIHVHRAGSSGDFGLVLMHAVSHIKASGIQIRRA